jgi:hypothetical protein
MPFDKKVLTLAMLTQANDNSYNATSYNATFEPSPFKLAQFIRLYANNSLAF